MNGRRGDLNTLGSLGQSLCEGASPDDSMAIADKMAELKKECESLERDMAARKRALDDGLKQVRGE